ncbi:MAG TPA: molybdenum cofactor biosynthesis protein B [Thermomicrobiales bacterium]|nr:molybdenum cofactor biosynthesis protein B [Thermomicrobiales bacterium]
MSQSAQEHRDSAPDSVACAVITVSDTRTPETDASGSIMRSTLLAAGHSVVAYEIVRDEPELIRSVLNRHASDVTCDAVLFNGGTGIARRDTTFDTLSAMLDQTLPGFGELFRMLSFEEIGPAAMLSRATAGVYRGRLVFSTPGSSNAVSLAMNKLIVPEIAHIIFETRK